MAGIAKTTDTTPERRRILWIEFLVVAIYLVLPQVFALFVQRPDVSGPLYSTYWVLYGLSRMTLVLYVARTSDGNFEKMGLVKPKWSNDVLLAIGAAAVYLLIVVVTNDFSRSPTTDAESSLGISRQLSETESLWSFLLLSAVAVMEVEVVSRGYTTGRLLELTSPAIAALGSSLMFSIYFVAGGLSAWTAHIVVSLLCATCFVRTRRIWPGLIARCLMILIAYGYYRFSTGAL